jgi:hypothetical protein
MEDFDDTEAIKAAKAAMKAFDDVEWVNEPTSPAMIKRSIDRLHNTITEFNEQSEKYSKRMHRLTWAMAVLAFVMAGMVGFQILLMLEQ